MAVATRIAGLGHRDIGLDRGPRQGRDVVVLGKAAVGQMLARAAAVAGGQRLGHGRQLAHVGAEIVDRHPRAMAPLLA
jgi:hypothetical protein